jgi:hypothetical protein
MGVERLAREIVANSDGKVSWEEALREAWWTTMAGWGEIENPEPVVEVEG